MVYIHVKNYSHFNRSMGKYINSKKQYQEEMRKGGYVPYDEGCQQAELSEKKLRKEYQLSKRAENIIRGVQSVAGRDGKVKLSDRMIDEMKDFGAIGRKKVDGLNSDKGGFYEDK